MRTLPVTYPRDPETPGAAIRPCVRCHLDFLAVAVADLSALDPALSRFPDLCVGCRVLEARMLPDRPLPMWATGI